jgi:hypothetical protein
MAQNDDWGWIVWIAVLGGGGYYLWDRYDIVDSQAQERETAEILADLPETRPSLPDKMYATTTKEGSEWSVDGTAIRGGRSARLAWLIEDHSNDSTVPHRTSKTLYEMDCDRGSYVVRSLIHYDADGKVSAMWKDDTFTDTPDFVAPSSQLAAVFRRACSRQVDDYLESDTDPITIPPSLE